MNERNPNVAPSYQLPPLLQYAPVAIASVDLSGSILDVNRAFAEASGYTPDEIRGRPFLSFVEPAVEREARASFEALARGEVSYYRAERRYRTRSDELLDVDLSVSLVRDDAGAPSMCLAVLQDVTPHRRALEAAARRAAELEAVIDSMPAAVYIGDASGISRANRRAIDQLGYETAADLQRDIAELSEELQNRFAETGGRVTPSEEPFARAITGEHVDTEIVSRHLRTGEDVVQRVIAAPIRHAGGIVGAVAVNIDVTDRKQTEEALRLSEERYRALVEQAPLSIQILAPDGRTLQVNAAWARLWGMTLEDVAGHNILEDAQLVERGLMRYIRQAFAGEASHLPVALYDANRTQPDGIRDDDSRRWVAAVIYPVKDAGGRVREVVLIHEDRTEQVLADERRREATELLQLVVQQSGEAIVVADAAGIVRVFNPAAERLYGVLAAPKGPEEWAAHYRLLQLDGSPLPFQETALHRAVNGQSVAEARWMVDRPDGARRTLAGSAAPLRRSDGTPAGAVLIARDDTDRLAAEQERERLLVETQRAHAEIQRTSRVKDEFLATLSHELRTPLHAILGWTRILRTRQFDEVTDRALGVIERNAAAQARLIDDLLDVSRIITGKIRLHIEPIDARVLSATALESVRPAADARGVRVETRLADPLPPVSADPQRLQQILWNLLSNAVKFTESGGRVTLELAEDARQLRISVADTGIGIAPAMLPFVFDRFTQADSSSTRHHAGLGLGLAIVRHLVELHGGTVAAESPGEGHGATFHVRLPRHA